MRGPVCVGARRPSLAKWPLGSAIGTARARHARASARDVGLPLREARPPRSRALPYATPLAGCLGVALLALVAGGVWADESTPSPVAVKVTAEPDTVTIGSRFRVTVEIQVQPGYELVFAQPSERLGEFDIVDFGEGPKEQRGADTVVRRWFTLAGFETGHKIVPAPPIRYRHTGDQQLTDAPEAHVVVTVESVLAKTPDATDVRDIRGPEPVPIDWRPWQVGGAALAVLVAVALLVRWLWRRRARGVVVAPPRPAHEVAKAALAALRRQGLVERGELKAFYSALSDIVRAYLEGRFALRAPEMTTEEFLQATARGGGLERAHRQLLAEFLVESDLVKFAKHVPTLADTERVFAAAERFVEDTAPRAEGELRAAG